MKLIIALFATLPGMAMADPETVCMPAGDMDAGLVDWYGEAVTSQSPDGTLALWQNAETGSWTLVEYAATGLACAVNSGESWAPSETQPDLLALLSR